VPAGIDQRATALDRPTDYLAHVNGIVLDRELTARDAIDIQ
jgi:hypothetical protein